MTLDRDKSLEQTRRSVSLFLKESREERIDRHKRLKEVMIGYGDGVKTLITFKDLMLFDVGARNELSEGVFFEKTYHSEDKMVFTTYMEKGGSFGIHSHECIEICNVLKGNLIERERGYKVYNKGESIIYAKNEDHRPYATEESVYEVIFLRDI